MFSVIVLPNIEPQTRRSHKKSRAGCRTCKDRKLKCDEVKPVCGACQRRYVDIESCDYGPRLPGWPDPSRPLAAAPQRKGSGASSARVSSSSSSSPRSGSDSDWQLTLPTSLRAELLDPFMTHPPSQVKGVDFLIKHYLKTAVYKGFPWQPASETNPTITFYVPLVWSDVVLFHATLQLSAWRLESCALQRPGLSFAYLSAECIRLLRDRVEKEERAAGVTDQTIGAVAVLAKIEHERENIKMVRVHLEGLRRMVSIRGGLNAIRETNPMVANSVFWAFAVGLYEIPYPNLDPVLPPFFPGDHNLALPQTPVVSIFQDFGPAQVEPPPLDLVAIGVVPSIATVVTSIQHVSQLIPTNAAYPTASTSLVMLTRMCTLLSHLLSLPRVRLYAEADSGTLPYSALISQSVRFATLLHVLTPWRGMPPDGTLTINHLLHQLMATLKELLSSAAFKNNALLLWIFAVAGVSAGRTPERAWFVSHLVGMAEDMRIAGWEEMKAHVRRVIWHERLWERPHRILWQEVVKKRKELEGGMGVE